MIQEKYAIDVDLIFNSILLKNAIKSGHVDIATSWLTVFSVDHYPQ